MEHGLAPQALPVPQGQRAAHPPPPRRGGPCAAGPQPPARGQGRGEQLVRNSERAEEELPRTPGPRQVRGQVRARPPASWTSYPRKISVPGRGSWKAGGPSKPTR
jgi:hypothetical protein